MSEDKNNDAQTNDEPKAEEQKPAEEPKPKKAAPKPKPDVVDEEELDIEIERVSPKPTSSCGPVAWILFILVLAVAAIFGGMKYNQDRIEAEKKARAEREATYQSQERTIRDNIDKASDYASKGDVENAYKQLGVAREKWSALATMANSARDLDKAQYALGREGDLKKVIDELDQYKEKANELQERADELAAEVDELEAERDEFNGKVNARILELAGAGGVGGAEAAATGTTGSEKPAAGSAKPGESKAEPKKADDEDKAEPKKAAKPKSDAKKDDEDKAEPKKTKKSVKKSDDGEKSETPKKKTVKKSTKKSEKAEAQAPEAPALESAGRPASPPDPVR